MNRLKWFLGVIIPLLILSMAVPVTYAGVSWTGVDPVFKVNGQQFNVWIEWPSEFTCNVKSPIAVTVRAPRDASVQFVSESEGNFGCGVITKTSTEIDRNGSNKVHISAQVESDSSFQVNVKVYVNGELVRTYSGASNDTVSGQPVTVP